ncbi:FAD-dependent oxidoreductase [Roseiarcaceae bacterium H3SJ34-1]|uniref:FAD-dependent oxidoreductase n=1 Tax=Terripilifer ovatus TaxID=3032367 RepID=UPI003AB9651C|nr:FAD-dependent oxidoreductase [Roseiarcaceae bacterium H3SJ34-1]
MALQTQTIAEPARQIPVAYDADVVVVGAGPGGFAAALQAARMGARVVLVERFDMPGGVHTSGLQGSAGPGVGGIHTELMQRFAAQGYIYTATQDTLSDWAGNPLSHYERYLKPDASFTRQSFNPEGAGSVMATMLQEAGVTALYGTSFVDTIVDKGSGNDTIKAIVVENASGRQAITGRIFIEGSGTAQLAAAAGVPFVSGGGGQPASAQWDGINRPIPGGLLWIMSGIEFPRVAAHQKSANDPMLSKLIAEASAAGDLPPGLYRPRMGGKNIYGHIYIGHPTIDMSPMQTDGSFILWQNVPYEWALRMDESADDDARAKRELRAFIDAEVTFLKKYVPGFEKAVLNNVGRFVGVRDGRHPIGEHVFCLADVLAGRRFTDAVTKPISRAFHWDEHRKHDIEVSYRSFLPKQINNLLLTGASLSFTYDTIFMVMRNFPWCTQTGEIAGYAAARCIEKKILPKELEWREPYIF